MKFYIASLPAVASAELVINTYSRFQRKANPFSYGTSEKDSFGSSESTPG
jgi:hypothetical protein